ncbi:MAG TPA: dienelactone hydrolase family protein [Pyrinomonadaceae bacterium]|nr:dienelactone hydrolase family protein [Pyrinomonadaceae bacterium]
MSTIIDKRVSFQTEDNWTIHGTLTRPATLVADEQLAAVLLLHSSSHDQDIFSQHGYPGFIRLQNVLITLRIDIRGRGQSQGPLELHSFTPQQRGMLYLDVRAALDFLCKQEGVDLHRIGILAEEISADSAVLGAAGDPRVKALVLISGRLSSKAKEMITANPQMAILSMVSSEDRDGFQDMTDGYKLSTNNKSDILIYNGLGLALAMFSTWRYNKPDERPLDELVADWLIERLNSHGRSEEVSFTTEDGWIISADLVRPIRQGRMPAIILVHSSVTDRNMYHTLVPSLVENGFVVLNLDFRGRGKSRNKGNWLELRLKTPEGVEAIDRGHLDIKAAVDYLSSQSYVEPARIGVVGTVIGARYALLSAAKDERIRTAVSVIGYVPVEAEREELKTLKIPVLHVLSRDLVPVTEAMTELYNNTKEHGGRLMVLSGGTYGYGIFTLNPTLVPTIVEWMKRELGQAKASNSTAA